MNALELFGCLFLGLIGFGCTLALIGAVVGLEMEARERDRRARARREARDLEWLYSMPSARVER